MFKERWLKREKIIAVHDNKLEELLSTMGLLHAVENGECHCSQCGIVITIENLGFLYPKEGKINFLCEKLSCLDKTPLYRESKNE